MNKIMFIILAATLYMSRAAAQNADPAINVVVMPGTIPENANTTLQATIGNIGNTRIVANSVEVIISVGTNAEITGISTGTGTEWSLTSQTSGNGNTITLRNTEGMIEELDGSTIFLNVTGRNASANGVISGSVAYIPGGNSSLPGEAENSSQGNGQPDNDASFTNLIVTPANPLPAHLLSFTGVPDGCNARLSWAAAEEADIDHYDVQASQDGSRFITVKTLKPDHENSIAKYTATVAQTSGKAYYRLRMSGTDGKAVFSNVVSISLSCGDDAVITAYPNPVANTVTVAGLSEGDAVALYNVYGQRVSGKSSTGGHLEFNMGALPAGQYRAVIIRNGKAVKSITLTRAD